MEKETTECAICGVEMDYDPELFHEGRHREPECQKCKEGE